MIIVLLVIFSLLIHTIVRPRVKHLAMIPTDVPQEVPIYDEENLDQISYVQGSQRAQAIEFLAFVPKAILSPLILTIENADEAAGVDSESLWESFIRILGTPVADHRNIVSVEWSELQASPSFIHSYYQTALTQGGYTETDELGGDRTRFENTKKGTTVIIQTEDNGNDQDGTEYAILKIYYKSSQRGK